MKRKYNSPAIFVVAINSNIGLLTINSVKGNTNLKLGKGSSGEARSRESRLWTDDDVEHEE